MIENLNEFKKYYTQQIKNMAPKYAKESTQDAVK